MITLPAQFNDDTRPKLGLIVLQADATVENEARNCFGPDTSLLVSRVRSGTHVTDDTLHAMADDLAGAAGLFPDGSSFDALAYACTSGSATIGAGAVARHIHSATNATAITDPVTALAAACNAINAKSLALVSPYIAPVSATLRQTLAAQGLDTPAFGSFELSREADVVRLSEDAIGQAAHRVTADATVDALFLSCTNLRTQALLPRLEAKLGLPVLSSNSVLFWHLCALAGVPTKAAPGRFPV